MRNVGVASGSLRNLALGYNKVSYGLETTNVGTTKRWSLLAWSSGDEREPASQEVS